MPELPDVEVFKRYFDATSLHQEINGVETYSERILVRTTPDELNQRLQGQSFSATRRYGKYLFAELDEEDWLVLHFGMTGGLQYFKDIAQEPEYVQMRFDFNNGYHLAYTMPRKLGEVQPIESVGAFIEEKELGPDALEIDFDAFRSILAGRRAMVKSTLMNQGIIAGIGNVYSDEVLFQTRIHPRTKINTLDTDTLKDLFDSMKEVLHTAIEHQADPEQFPDSYIIPRRDEGAKCPNCEGEVERIKVSGRSGYYCPSCQTR
jgi:formamidopyrimidine-DNA glycosylase